MDGFEGREVRKMVKLSADGMSSSPDVKFSKLLGLEINTIYATKKS